MRTIIASMAALLFALPLMSHAQATRAVLEDAAGALGASSLTSLEFAATGAMFDTARAPYPASGDRSTPSRATFAPSTTRPALCRSTSSGVALKPGAAAPPRRGRLSS